MPPRLKPLPGRCVICREPFLRQNSLATCCSPECQRERRLRCCRKWYRQHREEHIQAVLVARKRRMRGGKKA